MLEKMKMKFIGIIKIRTVIREIIFKRFVFLDEFSFKNSFLKFSLFFIDRIIA